MTFKDSCYMNSRWEGCRNFKVFSSRLSHRTLCSLKRNIACHKMCLMSVVILGLGKISPLLPLKFTRTIIFHLYKDSEGAPEDQREDKINKVLTGLHLVM